MMTVVRGITDILTNAVVVFGPPSEMGPNNFGVIGLGSVAGIPVALVILVVLSTLAYFVLSRTRLGRYTYAIGSNKEAARLSGIPVKRYLLAVYVILGLLTGVAGVICRFAPGHRPTQLRDRTGTRCHCRNGDWRGQPLWWTGQHCRHDHRGVSHRTHPRWLSAARHQLLLPKRHHRRRHLGCRLLGSIQASANYVTFFLGKGARAERG